MLVQQYKQEIIYCRYMEIGMLDTKPFSILGQIS
jgi:hypothetical protein